MPDLTSGWGRNNLDMIARPADFIRADVVKVGPKGYIHGWIFVGPQAIGARVFHPGRGHGTVRRAGRGKTTVHYDSGHKESYETKPPKSFQQRKPAADKPQSPAPAKAPTPAAAAPSAPTKAPRPSTAAAASKPQAEKPLTAEQHLDAARHNLKEGNNSRAVNHLTSAADQAPDKKSRQAILAQRDRLAARVMGGSGAPQAPGTPGKPSKAPGKPSKADRDALRQRYATGGDPRLQELAENKTLEPNGDEFVIWRPAPRQGWQVGRSSDATIIGSVDNRDQAVQLADRLRELRGPDGKPVDWDNTERGKAGAVEVTRNGRTESLFAATRRATAETRGGEHAASQDREDARRADRQARSANMTAKGFTEEILPSELKPGDEVSYTHRIPAGRSTGDFNGLDMSPEDRTVTVRGRVTSKPRMGDRYSDVRVRLDRASWSTDDGKSGALRSAPQIDTGAIVQRRPIKDGNLDPTAPAGAKYETKLEFQPTGKTGHSIYRVEPDGTRVRVAAGNSKAEADAIARNMRRQLQGKEALPMPEPKAKDKPQPKAPAAAPPPSGPKQDAARRSTDADVKVGEAGDAGGRAYDDTSVGFARSRYQFAARDALTSTTRHGGTPAKFKDNPHVGEWQEKGGAYTKAVADLYVGRTQHDSARSRLAALEKAAPTAKDTQEYRDAYAKEHEKLTALVDATGKALPGLEADAHAKHEAVQAATDKLRDAAGLPSRAVPGPEGSKFHAEYRREMKSHRTTHAEPTLGKPAKKPIEPPATRADVLTRLRADAPKPNRAGWHEAGDREVESRVRDAVTNSKGPTKFHLEDKAEERETAARELGAARAERADMVATRDYFRSIADDAGRNEMEREVAREVADRFDQHVANVDAKINERDAALSASEADAHALGRANQISRGLTPRPGAAERRRAAQEAPDSRAAVARHDQAEAEADAAELEALASQANDPGVKARLTEAAAVRRRAAQAEADAATVAENNTWEAARQQEFERLQREAEAQRRATEPKPEPTAHEVAAAERSRKLRGDTPAVYQRLLGEDGEGPGTDHKPSAKVIRAMRDNGWVLTDVRRGGITSWQGPDGRGMSINLRDDKHSFYAEGQGDSRPLTYRAALEHAGGEAEPPKAKAPKVPAGEKRPKAPKVGVDSTGQTGLDIPEAPLSSRAQTARLRSAADLVEAGNDSGAINRDAWEKTKHSQVERRTRAEVDSIVPASMRDELGREHEARIIGHEKEAASHDLDAQEWERRADRLDDLARRADDPRTQKNLADRAEAAREKADDASYQAEEGRKRAALEREVLRAQVKARTPQKEPERRETAPQPAAPTTPAQVRDERTHGQRNLEREARRETPKIYQDLLEGVRPVRQARARGILEEMRAANWPAVSRYLGSTTWQAPGGDHTQRIRMDRTPGGKAPRFFVGANNRGVVSGEEVSAKEALNYVRSLSQAQVA